MIFPLIIIGKFIYFISKTFNLGSGGTWPGEVALRINPSILSFFANKVKEGIILVAGTNGKTTTSLMIKKILEHEGLEVLHNNSGANLLNGIVSVFIKDASCSGEVSSDWGVFEVDENTLPIVLSFFTPKVVVILNLFRDQLDRYGEVDVIAEKWGMVLKKLPKNTKIVLNADDPQIAYLAKELKARAIYFGVDNPKMLLKDFDHATDSIFCLNCGGRLTFSGTYYSHIGIWRCDNCGEKRPKSDIDRWKSPLPGLYNQYNTLAAVVTARAIGINDSSIKKSLEDFSPAFGRQEGFEKDGKKTKIFLSKNPVGFNESLRTVMSQGAKEIVFALNDRIPDGQDVSWIWDVDFEMIPQDTEVIVSGERVYDMGLRIKYAIQSQNLKLKVYENLKKAINDGLNSIKHGETLYILPTYSAMLEVRKILNGRKIL